MCLNPGATEHIFPSVFPGELSTTYQNDHRIIEFKTLKEHWIKCKGNTNFLIYAYFKLYVPVVFKVTIVSIVRRCYNHRLNTTAYRKMATESLMEGELSPFITTCSAWRLSYFLNFTQTSGLFLTARFSGIDLHVKIDLLSLMSSGIVHK